MDAAAGRKQLYEYLARLCKEGGMKYSKSAFCAYQRLGEVFWKADLLCGFFLRDGALEVTAVSRVKPLMTDDVIFPIIDPEKPCRVTDATRAAASFAARGFIIGKTVHRLRCGDPAELERETRAMLQRTVEERDGFLGSPALERGLPAYLIHRWESCPYEAGLACLCAKDYAAARRCFQRAGETGRYEQLSVGRPGRYLYLVFIDYCKAMEAGMEWTEELAAGGFAE